MSELGTQFETAVCMFRYLLNLGSFSINEPI